MMVQVRITGPKVHGVGYRLHLLDMAIRYQIERLSLDRLSRDGGQEVVALAAGEEDQILSFLVEVKTDIPETAEVTSIMQEHYLGYINPIMATSWKLLSQQLHDLGPL